MAANSATHFEIDNPLSIEEIEFQAEDELISIIPKFKHQELTFISGTFGPFIPTMEVQVPLWLAINLRKRQQCRIVPPDWLDKSILSETLENETQNTEELHKINFHYIEISSLLFNVASEDIVEVDHVRTLLEDIQNVRMAKLNRGIKGLAKISAEDGITHVDLTNIASLEIFQIRSFLMGSLNHFRQLSLVPSTLARRTDEVRTSGYSSSRLGNRLGRTMPSAATAATTDTTIGVSGGNDNGTAGPMPSSTRKFRRIH